MTREGFQFLVSTYDTPEAREHFFENWRHFQGAMERVVESNDRSARRAGEELSPEAARFKRRVEESAALAAGIVPR